MENYLSVEDAVRYTNLSLSTIRRYVKTIKASNNHKSKKTIKSASSGGGKPKDYISIAFLDSIKNDSKGSKSDSMNDSMNTSNELIEVLKSQLLEKDKQINELIERSRESNFLLSQMQQKVLMLDEPKKKKWYSRK